MSWLQVVAVMITIGLNALDGFDVLSISFASPGIAKEWGIDRAALGIVLSMELIGMAIGSVTVGGLADRIGRCPTMLGCLVVMTIGMFLASFATSVADLMLWRLLTGLGIGGMLATINAVAAEYASLKRRNLCVSLMAIGYPIGAVLGGMVVAHLLKGSDWRAVFHLGAFVTALFIPLVLLWVPESVAWLCQRPSANALHRINRVVSRMGHAAVTALPAPAGPVARRSIADVLKPGLVGTTLLITLVYSLHIPTHVRATGTGFAIGFGRGGAALAPIIAGFLFKAGQSLQVVSLLFGIGSLVAAGALMMLRTPAPEEVPRDR